MMALEIPEVMVTKEVESMIKDLKCACPDVEDNNGYDEEQDNLNYYLKDFYDMCDNARVWIGI